ncbi:MAG TPA: hypothetical protein VFL31_02970 [Nitrospiraceae bacterium]|nr:hypothetical protein [Nitrospiraceae bacterium]
MQHIEELKRQGLSVTAIAGVTGFDRKTIRKYLAHPELLPRYRPRPKKPSLLERWNHSGATSTSAWGPAFGTRWCSCGSCASEASKVATRS